MPPYKLACLSAFAVLAGSGCTAPNPDLCQINADCPSGNVCGADHRCAPAIPDAGEPIDAPETAVDASVDAMVDAMSECSVPCTDPAAPVCDMNQCRGCEAHDECESGICQVDSGMCVGPEEIAYVATGGHDEAGCGSATSPCKSINFALGLGRVYVHLAPGTYLGTVTIDGGDTALDVVGPGAELVPVMASLPGIQILAPRAEPVTLDGITVRDATGSGGYGIRCESDLGLTLIGVTVADNAVGITSDGCDVTLQGGTVSGNSGDGVSVTDGDLVIAGAVVRDHSATNAVGVTHAGSGQIQVLDAQLLANASGISVTAGGILTVRRSQILGSTSLGIYAEGGFDLTNNVVAGTAESAGIFLAGDTSTAILAHNTIVANGDIGVQCHSTLASVVAATSNIVWDNGTAVDDSSSRCAFSYSDVQVDIPGEGNINLDPRFVDAEGGDFHLTAASPCRNTGDPESTITDDLDGDTRPAEGRSDVGADEFVP